jgi:nicotinate-nucleotide pyrophosphorylase (carboxylating)
MTDIPFSVKDFIRNALEEDIGSGDITTSLLFPEGTEGQESTALLIAKSSFVLAGLPFAKEVFRCVDDSVRLEQLVEEGSRVRKADVLAKINGRTRTLLMCERVSLNILQRLSGIASLTNKFVRRIKDLNTKVLDTRKTTPCMRYMERYAVRMGGGTNHRSGLYDGILIKDNHIEAAGGIRKAVLLAKEGRYFSRIEVEAETLKEFKEALNAGADIIMLDNMPVADIKEAVRLARGRVTLEASGNVTPDNIREIAETGVGFVSIGALTHSAHAVDISMKIMG